MVFGVPNRLVHMASWVWMWSRDVTVVSSMPSPTSISIACDFWKSR